MGLLDFFKGKKKRGSRRSGVRKPVGRGRRPEMGTQAMGVPKPLTPPPPIHNATVARPAPVFDPGPSPGPSPQGFAPPPRAQRDAGATEYLAVPKSSRGPVVGVLVAIDGELTGQLYGVMDGVNKLGRGSDSDIELASQKISRDHAEIRHAHGMFAVKPLTDKNPTFLNDRETQGEELSDGDTLKLGQTTFKFRTI